MSPRRLLLLLLAIAASPASSSAQQVIDAQQTNIREILRGHVNPDIEPNLDAILGKFLKLPPKLAFDSEYERQVKELECLQKTKSDVVSLQTAGVYPVGDYLCASELAIGDGVILELTSASTVISVSRKLTITGTATLRPRQGAALPPPVQPPRAADGGSYNPGPDTEGPGNGDTGAAGGHGAHGQTGAPGAPGGGNGCNLGHVEIRLGEEAVLSGSLVIEGHGSNGGRGGPGGDGGDGGNGQQGGRSVFKRTIFGIAYCDKGPGWGGAGGNGGNGGTGGTGGCGQSGLDVKFKSMTINPFRGSTDDFAIAHIDLSGGKPGAGGPPGRPGHGGRGGWGGRGSTACMGAESNRRGDNGQNGNNATEGACGEPAVNGHLVSEDGIAVHVVKDVTVAPPGACRPVVDADCAQPKQPGSGNYPPRSCAETQVIHGVWDTLAAAVGDLQSDELPVAGLECPVQFLTQKFAPADDTTPAAIRTFTYIMTLHPPPPPVKVCGGEPGVEHVVCCNGDPEQTNISAECLAGTDLSAPATRILFALGLYSLVGAELSKTTRLVGVNDDFGPSLRSGGTYLVWRGPAANGTFKDDQLMLTELNADVVARLARILDILLPKLREARGAPPPYPNTIRCDANGFAAVNFDWSAPSKAYPFAIAPPDPVAIRRPPSTPAAAPTTLEIRADSSTSFFRIAPRGECVTNTACANGKTNSCLLRGLRDFARLGLDPFPCLGATGAETIVRRFHQLNDRDTAAILFYGIYILGTWRTEGMNP